ncbi:MAG: hypothetical protein ABI847_12565 [Anaerolineales bacterium]
MTEIVLEVSPARPARGFPPKPFSPALAPPPATSYTRPAMRASNPANQPANWPAAWLDLASAAAALAAGLLAYWPVLTYSFFWEDPFDIGQVQPYTYLQLLTVPNSNSYYRPLTLILLKLLKLGQPVFNAVPYHLFVVAGHLAAAVLLFGLARYLFHSRAYALAAALIFTLYPVSFEAVARAISPHTWLAAATLGALWLYAWARLAGRRWPAVAALLLMALAQLTHENGLLFPGLVLALELWLVWQRRVPRFQPWVLIYFVPAVVFALIWLSIPKPAGLSVNLGLRPYEALYLSQGLSYPVAGLLGGLGRLSPEWQAGLALLITLILLILLPGRKQWPRLLLALAWWVMTLSLAWLTRSFDYLAISPRLLYLGSIGAALAWAGLIDTGSGWPALGRPVARRAAGSLALVAVLLLEGLTLSSFVILYRDGSRLMDSILAAGRQAGEGGRLLFINIPDRFEYRAPAYPLGYWGMLLAPVSQDLADFVHLATGLHVETRSLSDLPLLAGPLATSPYNANTRGSDAHASAALYESARWAGRVYLTQYAADGRLELIEAGHIAPAAPTPTYLAQVDGLARLVSAQANIDFDGSVHLELTWQSLAAAGTNDTVFIHLFDADGQLVAQADGDSLQGLILLSAWRPGDQIRDERVLIPDSPLAPGAYQIRTGLYDRATGQRYPAQDPQGNPAPDDSIMATMIQFEIPRPSRSRYLPDQ